MKKLKEAKRLARIFISVTGLEAAAGGLGELAAVSSLMKKSGDLRAILVSPIFSSEERRTALDVLKGKLGLSDGTVKFLAHLCDTGMAGLLEDITRLATKTYFEKMQMDKATVTTPSAVGGKYEERLKESVRKLTGREVEITYETDPSLLGGVLVKVGSTMFDSTIKGQLRLLKDELIKE